MMIVGDARRLPLADASVQTVVTSPPYFGLRDYGVDGQIGLGELDGYMADMLAVASECWRVLRDDGTFWMVIGDTYSQSGGAGGDYRDGGLRAGQPRFPGRRVRGLRPKSLIGVPWRLALRMMDAGWILRAEIIWHKPNPYPESAADRPTRAHETVFLFAKNPDYYVNPSALKEPAVGGQRGKASTFQPRRGQGVQPGNTPQKREGRAERYDGPLRHMRNVWTIPPSRGVDGHYATFPVALAERMIRIATRPGDIVLDPFAGTATTGVAALRIHRRFVGVELNPQTVAIARERLASVQFAFPELEAE